MPLHLDNGLKRVLSAWRKGISWQFNLKFVIITLRYPVWEKIMTTVKIVTDSLANLTKDEIEKYDIRVANLNVLVDGISYVDNESFVNKENFYNVLAQAKELPKTSQPSIGTFLDIYDSFEEGTEIISLHVASCLSGTGSAAKQAGDLSKNHVTVIDTEFADRGEAFQVLAAAKLAQQGASKSEIIAEIERVKNNTVLYLCIFTLENLVKGGRVGKAAGILSNLLNIKVALALQNNVLVPVHKGRGDKSIQKFLDEVIYPELEKDEISDVGLAYVSPSEFVLTQEKRIQDIAKTKDLVTGFTVPTISIHTGQGAFAMMYCKK